MTLRELELVEAREMGGGLHLEVELHGRRAVREVVVSPEDPVRWAAFLEAERAWDEFLAPGEFSGEEIDALFRRGC